MDRNAGSRDGPGLACLKDILNNITTRPPKVLIKTFYAHLYYQFSFDSFFSPIFWGLLR